MRLPQSVVAEIAEMLPLVGSTPQDIQQQALDFDSLVFRRTFATTAWLQRSVPLERPPSWQVRRMRTFTFGFISVGPRIFDVRRGVEKDNLSSLGNFPQSDGFTFGISVIADRLDGNQPQLLLDEIELAGIKLPVIATHTDLVLHQAPPHVGQPTRIGSSTCWVENRASNPSWSKGVFTARHVVQHLAPQTQVALDCTSTYSTPQSGWVGDYGECTVDAAIVAIDPSDWPTGLQPLLTGGPFKHPIASGQPIAIDGRHTSAAGTLISHHTLPGYWGAMMGQRIITDIYGIGGDSGALVEETTRHCGIGAYMGEIDDGAGGKQGMCQDLHQAKTYLEVDLYR